jgi:4'-phosphopantetheinyl transferase
MAVSTAAGVCPTRARITSLGPGEVRVWLAELDAGAAVVDRMVAVLSPDERERAGRFHFRRDAMRWIVARATLRDILGSYLETDPGAIAFTYGKHGKPALGGSAEGADLQFSVSHSADLAAYAVTIGAPVGVDVERLRAVQYLDAVAERAFSPRECAVLRALPVDLGLAGFFNCWTRKEAYIKALGEGLSYPLERFSVSLAPGAPARLESVDDAPAHLQTWTMEALPLPAGFAGAVVVARHPARVVCERWGESRR